MGRREDARKLEALRAHLRASVEAMERGDYDEVRPEDIGRYLEGLTRNRRPRKRTRR